MASSYPEDMDVDREADTEGEGELDEHQREIQKWQLDLGNLIDIICNSTRLGLTEKAFLRPWRRTMRRLFVRGEIRDRRDYEFVKEVLRGLHHAVEASVSPCFTLYIYIVMSNPL